MGLDYAVYIKSASGNMIPVAYGKHSRYYGYYEMQPYLAGSVSDVVYTLLEACKTYPEEILYYGHDHQDESKYTEVNPKLIHDLCELFFKEERK